MKEFWMNPVYRLYVNCHYDEHLQSLYDSGYDLGLIINMQDAVDLLVYKVQFRFDSSYSYEELEKKFIEELSSYKGVLKALIEENFVIVELVKE